MTVKLKDLSVYYHTQEQQVNAVDGVSVEISNGEVFGLVGESGCGKTTLAKTINRTLPSNSVIADGEIWLDDTQIDALSDAEMRQVRWERVSMISQSAMNALNPAKTIFQQIEDAIRAHRDDISTTEIEDMIVSSLEEVGIDPERSGEYPHQFSGGMKQRVMIAMALVLEPEVIIADEPTTALDVINQDTILEKLETLQQKTGATLLIITHDMSVVADICDRVGVMYGGRLIETGPTADVLKNPAHPYTAGLRNSFPRLESQNENRISIPGVPPDLTRQPDECRFIDRCPFAESACEQHYPPLVEVKKDHASACTRIEKMGIETMQREARRPETWQEGDTE